MDLKSNIKKTIKYCAEKRRHSIMIKHEVKKFEDPRRVAIWSEIVLTREQEQLIDALFVPHYGKRIPYTWHRHFTAFTGVFDPYYIPETLYIPEFEYYMNSNRDYINVFADKNVLSLIAKGVGIHSPETIISCANGTLRDGQYNVISWDEVLGTLPNETCFVKPTVDSDSGRGCVLLNKNNSELVPILKAMGNNFVIQERLVCSKSIQKIYAGSVNTFRVMTYKWDGRIVCAPIIMRIGRNGSFLDNAHAGGIFIAVNRDGTLHKSAFTEFKEEFTAHPDSLLCFEGYKIANFDRVIESAIKMHAAIPQLGVINWDFTIDENENPVLIEANTSGGSIWLFQMAWGQGVFEDNTIPVLEWLKERNKK